MDVVIEPEQPEDHDAIRALVRAAFSDHESVADLVDLIRASPEFVPKLALVARQRDEVVGFVLLSHAELVDEHDARHRVLTLSPLAVLPAVQGGGIGSALVPAGLAAAEAVGEPLVVLEGSPRYYARFGFVELSSAGDPHHPAGLGAAGGRDGASAVRLRPRRSGAGSSTLRRSPPPTPGRPDSSSPGPGRSRQPSWQCGHQ